MMTIDSCQAPGPTNWIARFQNMAARRLRHPHLAFHLALVAMMLTLPALWVGFQFDDFSQRLSMLGTGRIAGRAWLGVLDAFSFLDGNPFIGNLAKDMGVIPWWAPSELQLSFMRYLSAASMWIDYRLWPDCPALMHFHSMLWYAAVVGAATALYRRLMGVTTAAGLAALFFALDYSHGLPVGWLANRYALICVFFGILCLYAYDQWRREGRPLHGLLCPVFLALALLGGEMAIATGAYLLAYALFLDGTKTDVQANRPSVLKRLWALWPCALVFLCWLVAYKLLGYGAQGSGQYIDPLRSPGLYGLALIERAPLLLVGQWSHLSTEILGNFMTPRQAIFLAICFLAALAFLVIPLIRKDALSRFWFTGMMLSVLPVAATHPSNRLLMFIGIGAMGLLAQAVRHLWHHNGILPISRLWRIPAFAMIFYLLFVRLIISPPSLAFSSFAIMFYGNPLIAATQKVLADPDITAQDIILVNAPDPLANQLLWYSGANEGRRPHRIRTLSGGSIPVRLERIDETGIRITLSGGLFQSHFGRLFRSDKDAPMNIDDVFSVAGMSARIVSVTENNGPKEILYRFSEPLEASSHRFLQWIDCDYAPFPLPKAGQTVELPGFNPYDYLKNGCAKKRSR